MGSLRDLLILIVVTVVSAALVAAGYVGLLVAAGLIPTADLTSAALRYWVGDVIGIIVVTPFLLMLWMRGSGLRISREALLQISAIAAAQTIVFGYAEEKQLQLFYVVFLPIIWLAVRTGIEGASIGILITQVGLILGLQLVPGGTRDIIAFQTLMLILAITGLVVGQVVTERQCTEVQLRLHQVSLARVARFGSVGEFAAALAHELNQPLMAAGTMRGWSRTPCAEATPHRTWRPISPRKQSHRSNAPQPCYSVCGRWCGLAAAIAWRARSITLSGELLTYASLISIG